MSNVIAIGALGGSGTRAVAEIFRALDVYIGDDLNRSNDNLVFTRLFKNPIWYENASPEEIQKRFHIFKEYMECNKLSLNNFLGLLRADLNNPVIHRRIKFHHSLFLRIFSSKKKRTIWGWKEPNTQIYLKEIDAFFENLKYIHILRNGLDMAFSNNRQQLRNWGYKYNIKLNGTEDPNQLARKQLDYWIRSTKDIIEKSKNLKGDILFLNHTKFCLEPKKQIDRLVNFTQLKVSQEQLNKAYEIPVKPKTLGRYKNHDLSIFDSSQLDFVKKMGFEI